MAARIDKIVISELAATDLLTNTITMVMEPPTPPAAWI